VSGASAGGCAEVLEFWFADTAHADPQTVARRFEWWFRGGADAAILRRFTALHARAVAGELAAWADEPLSRLALIVVLDQFSRTIHRGTPGAFAQDPRALALAEDGIARGHYAALATPWQRTFFLMPLGHAEDVAHLEHAVALAEELASNADAPFRPLLEHSASQARGHRDVVARFGRQPHRNAVLGRASTPDELAYLADGKLVHERALPAALAGK